MFLGFFFVQVWAVKLIGHKQIEDALSAPIDVVADFNEVGIPFLALVSNSNYNHSNIYKIMVHHEPNLKQSPRSLKAWNWKSRYSSRQICSAVPMHIPMSQWEMGKAMALNLLRDGFKVTVSNRSPSKVYTFVCLIFPHYFLFFTGD